MLLYLLLGKDRKRQVLFCKKQFQHHHCRSKYIYVTPEIRSGKAKKLVYTKVNTDNLCVDTEAVHFLVQKQNFGGDGCNQPLYIVHRTTSLSHLSMGDQSKIPEA